MGMMSVFVGAMVGGCFGVIITSLAVAAKRVDEQNGVYEIEKRCVPEPAPPVSGERIIRFTDPNGVLLFTIPDGACVNLMYGDGERVAGNLPLSGSGPCRDQWHEVADDRICPPDADKGDSVFSVYD